VLYAFDSFLECACDGGGHTTGVRIESQYTSKSLEPERIREAAQHFFGDLWHAISRASRRMRPKSHAGALPG
jgi:hypothetical protein